MHAAPRESEWRWRGGRARTAPREARCVRLRQFRQRARGRERAGRGNRPSRTRPARAPRRSHRTSRARAHAELCEKPLAPSGRRAEAASRPGNGTCGGDVPCRARCALSRLPVRAFSSLAGVSTTRAVGLCGPVPAHRPPHLGARRWGRVISAMQVQGAGEEHTLLSCSRCASTHALVFRAALLGSPVSSMDATQEFLRAYESEMWSMQVLALRGIRRGGARSLTRHPCSVCPPLPLQSLLAEREVVTMHNHAMSSGQTKGSSML